jgi:hypothetical protein
MSPALMLLIFGREKVGAPPFYLNPWTFAKWRPRGRGQDPGRGTTVASHVDSAHLYLFVSRREWERTAHRRTAQRG